MFPSIFHSMIYLYLYKNKTSQQIFCYDFLKKRNISYNLPINNIIDLFAIAEFKILIYFMFISLSIKI